MEPRDNRQAQDAPQFEIDLTDAEAARKAFIASEIFKRKY